jgi:hypothetical protein
MTTIFKTLVASSYSSYLHLVFEITILISTAIEKVTE